MATVHSTSTVLALTLHTQLPLLVPAQLMVSLGLSFLFACSDLGLSGLSQSCPLLPFRPLTLTLTFNHSPTRPRAHAPACPRTHAPARPLACSFSYQFERIRSTCEPWRPRKSDSTTITAIDAFPSLGLEICVCQRGLACHGAGADCVRIPGTRMYSWDQDRVG